MNTVASSPGEIVDLTHGDEDGDDVIEVWDVTDDRKPAAKQDDDRNIAAQTKGNDDRKRAASPQGGNEMEAYHLAEEIKALMKSVGKDDPEGIVTVFAPDDLVHTCKRILETQEEFHKAGKPTAVDVGYHYTKSKHLESIREKGLLCQKDRVESKIKTKSNGAAYGEGIYTCPNSMAFAVGYGDTGLMLARVRGMDADYLPPENPARGDINAYGKLPAKGGKTSIPSFDSVTVNREKDFEITVLSCSRMCIPVLQYSASHVLACIDSPDQTARHVIAKYHMELQGIIDKILNEKYTTSVARRTNQKYDHTSSVGPTKSVLHKSPRRTRSKKPNVLYQL